ncbi:MAG: SUMF1/EgtB/PvdO family nonheme iron enzyme [Blastocatellia bacterium]|nr:SUMF1/EgtB/PvdO family nonheme iron enzyme [Blastocatellia bacterium]
MTLLVNRYLVLKEMGSGAFGETYLVEDTHLPSRRKCILKRLKPIAHHDTYQMILERFQIEASILERLGDESQGQVPRLYAYFSEDDKFYLVQEWIEGRTLKEILRDEGPFSEQKVRELLIGLLPAVEYIHSQNIIHRDIKPDNVMIRERTGKPVLIDFGMVKVVLKSSSGEDSTSSVMAGTPAYMPVEQVFGKPVFPSDLYSVGMTMIALMTGKNLQDIAKVPGNVKWREHAPQVSEEFAGIINKATELYVENRYQSAREMLEEVSRTTRTAVLPAAGPATLEGMDPAAVTTLRHFELDLNALATDPTIMVPPTQKVKPLAPVDTTQLASEPTLISPPTPLPAPPPQLTQRIEPPTQASMLRMSNMADKLDAAFWDSIKDTTNPRNFTIYLSKFPNGIYRDEARAKFEFLARATFTPKGLPALDTDSPQIRRSGAIPAAALKNSLGMEFVMIRSGTFVMGSAEIETEKPPHTVNIVRPFYLSKYPTTQAQWEAVMGGNPSEFFGDDHPVESVSWINIQEFLKRLNSRGEKLWYRLPSEAEWEYACRAGSTGRFCFGDDEAHLGNYAWFDENSDNGTSPVGQKEPNVWGLHDMHGNVWEWCQDWYHESYVGAPTDGSAREDEPEKKFRVLRGGSWLDVARYCRAARRLNLGPEIGISGAGFRVAAVPRERGLV